MPTKRTRPQQHLTIGNLSDAQRDHLRLIGGGNLTEGIRRLLDQAQESPKWEYLLLEIDPTLYEKPLDDLGRDGWEMFALFSQDGHTWATFKRRVVTEASTALAYERSANAREPKE